MRAPLIGTDTSHHNVPFSRYFGDFSIHKATEGTTFIDSDLNKWAEDQYAGENQKLLMLYHFMSNPYNWEEELTNFVTQLSFVEVLSSSKIAIALDLEAKALEKAIREPKAMECVNNFLGNAGDRTGKKKCFLYTNTYGTNKLSKKLAVYPLWIASYNHKAPIINKDWEKIHFDTFGKKYFIWQFTSTPFDIDIAQMTEDEWKSFT